MKDSNEKKTGGIEYIVTPHVKRIIGEIHDTVKQARWLFVTGDPGTGKTELCHFLRALLIQQKKQITIVHMDAWVQRSSRASSLMAKMIRTLAPDLKIPQDPDARREALSRALLRTVRERRDVLVTIDNCEALNEDSFREIKKVWETRIAHSARPRGFGLVMFGKPTVNVEHVLSGREIGFRARRIPMKALTDKQIIDFAETRFGLRFQDGQKAEEVRDYFCQMVLDPTPLGVENLCLSIQNHHGFNGKIDQQAIASTVEADVRDLMQRYAISQADLRNKCIELFKTPKGFSAATINNYVAGKPVLSSRTRMQIGQALHEEVRDREGQQAG